MVPTLSPVVAQNNNGMSDQTALAIGSAIGNALGALGPNPYQQAQPRTTTVNYVEKDCGCPPSTQSVTYSSGTPCTAQTTYAQTTYVQPPQTPTTYRPTTQTSTTVQSQNQTPVKQSAGSACADPANQNVELPAPARMKPNALGHINCVLMAPRGEGSPMLGQPYAYFSDLPTPDNEVPGHATAGIYFQSGFVRQGKKVIGSLGLRWEGNQATAVVRLRTGEEIPVGRLTETEKTTTFPHRARIDFDFGACITQYLTTDGQPFSGGTGYIVMP
jgi:hypothetical protein